MFCKNCGEQLEDHARFCPKCGTVAAGKVEEPKYEAAGKTGIEEKQQFRPVYALIAGVVLLLLLCVVILPKKPEKLILGEWYGAEDGTGLEFNKDGTGQIGKFYSFQWDIDRYEILTLKFEYEDLELELAWDADDKGKVSGTWYVDKESIAISGEDYYRSEAEALAHSGEAEVETEQELEPDEGGYLADAEPEEEAAQTGVSDEEREKRSKYLSPAKKDGKWVIINLNNEVVAEVENQDIEYTYGFTESGLAAVCNGEGEWGYINTKGKMVIPCNYMEAWPFEENGLAAVCNAIGRWGWINEQGQETISCIYSSVRVFGENDLAAAYDVAGKWGWINEQGEEVIPFIWDYSYGYFFENGLAAVSRDGSWGCINKRGEEVIPCIYDSIIGAEENEKEGLVAVEKDGRTILFDKWGEEEVSFNKPYNQMGDFSEDLVLVCDEEGKYGYIDIQGKEVIPCSYRLALDFGENGLAAVSNREEKWGYINKAGEMVLPFVYDSTYGFGKDGVAQVQIDGSYGYINEDGTFAIPCSYKDMLESGENGEYVIIQNYGDLWGVIDKKGNVIITPQYEDLNFWYPVETIN